MGHWGVFADFPEGGIDGDFALFGAFFDVDFAVLHGVVEDLFGDTDVLLAVFLDVCDIAFAPPFHRNETIGGLFCVHGC